MVKWGLTGKEVKLQDFDADSSNIAGLSSKCFNVRTLSSKLSKFRMRIPN